MEKTFQIEFKVSPPVLSDWKHFFLGQMRMAFPQHSDEEFLTVYRIYRTRKLRANLPTTPREVKLFLNNLGSYHRQWGDEISLTLQALYTLLADSIKAPDVDLIAPEFLDERIRRLINEPLWQRYLAALHFNVKPNKALEVLMAPAVESALSSGNTDDLKELKDVPGFPTVCEQVIEANYDDWSKKDPASLSMAALVLEKLPTDRPEFRHIWHRLSSGIKQVQTWPVFTEKTAEGIAIVLDHADEIEAETLKQEVLKSMLKPSTEIEDPQRSQEETKNWAKGALHLIERLNANGNQELLKSLFYVPSSSGHYLEIMRHLDEAKAPSSGAQFFRPQVPIKEVMSELVNVCNGGNLHSNYAAAINTMLKVDVEWQWKTLIGPLNQRFQTGNNMAAAEFSGCIRALFLLTKQGVSSEAENALKTIVTQGHLFHQLHQIQKDPQALALGLLAILLYAPEGIPQSTPGSAQAGIEIYKKFISAPSKQSNLFSEVVNLSLEFEVVPWLLKSAKESPTIGLVVSDVLDQLSVRDDLQTHLPVGEFVEKFETISEIVKPESIQRLIALFVDQKVLVPELKRQQFSIASGRFYIQIFGATSGHDHDNFGKYLVENLKLIDRPTWVKAFQERDAIIDLLIHLRQSNIEIGLTHGFHDAIREFVQAHCRQDDTTNAYKDRWSIVISALEDNSKITLMKNTWDDINAPTMQAFDGIIDLYEDMLLSVDITDDLADESLRQAFSKIVERKHAKELEWLAKVFKEKPEFYSKATAASKNTFSARVGDILLRNSEGEEAMDGYLQDIASRIGLNTQEIKTERVEKEDPNADEKVKS